MANFRKSPVPRGERIPLSRFWLDWRISFFLLGVCAVVVLAGVLALGGWLGGRPPAGSASATAHHERAAFYEGLGRIDDAIGEYRAAAALDPTDPALQEALGRLYEERGRIAEAIAAYERALELDPASSEARAVRARLEQLRRPR